MPISELRGVGARIEHTPRKSLKYLVHESGVSKCIVRRVTQMLKLTPYKTVIHAIQSRDHVSWFHFFSLFPQSVDEGEIDAWLLFSDEMCFHLHRYLKQTK
jgi:hypothetical protein